MKTLRDFKLETYFSKWEFKAKYHMTASDAESMLLSDLLAMATPEERDEFMHMSLRYTQTYGEPDLRETIATNFENRTADEILCFAGASEGIFVANNIILDKDSHAIALTPNYQSHESLPEAICAISGVPLDADDNWSLDIDRVAAAIQKNTKLLTINFPHNPTGANLPRERFDALIDLCRKHGIYILSDEIFRGLGPTGAEYLPPVADLYERGLSLDVMSKSYGLPGLRIGWIACQDKDLLSKMERMKHYTSICNSGPSEKLAKIAIRNKDKIHARNCSIIDKNLIVLNAFFKRHENLFDWTQPDASCMGFPRYKGKEGVEEFARSLIEESSVFILPSSIYQSDLTDTPTDRFRVGFGRLNVPEGFAVLEQHILQST